MGFQNAEGALPLGVTQPVVSSESMYSPTGLSSVMAKPPRASSLTSAPIRGSLARPAWPNWAHPINSSASVSSCPLFFRSMVAKAGNVNLRAQGVIALIKVHNALARVPFVETVIIALGVKQV